MNRKIDDLGRLSIPKEMRDKIGLVNGKEAHIELLEDKIIVSNPDTKSRMDYLLERDNKLQTIETIFKNEPVDLDKLSEIIKD